MWIVRRGMRYGLRRLGCEEQVVFDRYWSCLSSAMDEQRDGIDIPTNSFPLALSRGTSNLIPPTISSPPSTLSSSSSASTSIAIASTRPGPAVG
jgi:hypothetical protein